MATTYTSYINEDGEKKTGVVDGGSAPDGYWKTLQSYYEKMYADQLEANETAAAQTTARSLADIRARISGLNDSYRLTNRQLYRDYMDSKKNLDQSLAAKGYTGGMTESGRIALDTGYQESLGANERERLSGVSALEKSAADAEQAARDTKKTADQKAEEQYYANYMAVLKNLQSQQSSEAEQAAKADSATYSKALERASTLAKYGDFSGYRALGYSEAELAKMRSVWLAANPRLAWA